MTEVARVSIRSPAGWTFDTDGPISFVEQAMGAFLALIDAAGNPGGRTHVDGATASSAVSEPPAADTGLTNVDRLLIAGLLIESEDTAPWTADQVHTAAEKFGVPLWRRFSNARQDGLRAKPPLLLRTEVGEHELTEDGRARALLVGSTLSGSLGGLVRGIRRSRSTGSGATAD